MGAPPSVCSYGSCRPNAGEPLLEVTAPIAEAQLVETYLLNQTTPGPTQVFCEPDGDVIGLRHEPPAAGSEPLLTCVMRDAHGTHHAALAEAQ